MTNIDTTRTSLRKEMPVSEKWAYFDHAAVSPITAPAAKILSQWLEEATRDGTTAWLSWARKLAEVRRSAAKLLNADIDEIALVHNTTSGINLVAEGLDWQSGDNVVTLEDEFPSNLYPWMNLERLGVETRRVPTQRGRIILEQLAAACDENTRVVTASWIGYSNGCRRDVRAIADIAHAHNALFFLDAIQGVGVFPIDVKTAGVDCLAADGHKWMLGPEGAGIAYISKSSLEQLTPVGVGWNSVVHAADFSRIELKLRNSAERYEGGTYNMAGFLGLGASIDLLASLGIENVAAAILENTDKICEELSKLGADIYSPRESDDEKSGIVMFTLPDREPNDVRKHCLESGVALACRGGRLRVSAHAYNNDEDIQRLVSALQSV